MKIKNICKNEAANFEIRIIDKIINYFINKNYDIDIKFRSNEELTYFNKFSIYKNIIRCIDINEDIYSIISNYKILFGFNTTILWKQSLYESNQTLISYQLVKHEFYNIYEFNNKVNFIETNSNIDLAINHVLSKPNINYIETSYPSIEIITNKYLRNG